MQNFGLVMEVVRYVDFLILFALHKSMID
jgi:hypothetical protein